ncbi:hypothetical protein QU660_08675 [Stomatobaculum sp. F0698]|uniref:hypothetical protein n=1 Tax=Stomatobaculum sp. F0698 TaxID=3059030 RepID=UPI00272C8AE6|nr:hypothetical protein [Stomatobaculum sp. F0698]WLD86554.1 hypothetical protein QU660_08675 [Stomatobaculum sp. F0698]
MANSLSLRRVYLFRMILGVLIISLAVAEVLASKLLTELPLLRLVAGLGILWLIGTLLIRRMDSECLLRSGQAQKLQEADAALYRLRRFEEKLLSKAEFGILMAALLFMIVRQRLW